jgi:hypothetical protein
MSCAGWIVLVSLPSACVIIYIIHILIKLWCGSRHYENWRLPHKHCPSFHDEAVRISTTTHVSFDEAFIHMKNCATHGRRCSLKDNRHESK